MFNLSTISKHSCCASNTSLNNSFSSCSCNCCCFSSFLENSIFFRFSIICQPFYNIKNLQIFSQNSPLLLYYFVQSFLLVLMLVVNLFLLCLIHLYEVSWSDCINIIDSISQPEEIVPTHQDLFQFSLLQPFFEKPFLLHPKIL